MCPEGSSCPECAGRWRGPGGKEVRLRCGRGEGRTSQHLADSWKPEAAGFSLLKKKNKTHLL